MIIVEQSDPRDPQATALLQSSHALMESLFPPEDNFYLSIDALCAPDIRFFTAREGATILGTGALAIKQGYGEIKSMFVAEPARGRGVADALMRQIEDVARGEGLAALMLETGNVLHAAHALYRRHGFTDRGPFGDYPAATSSIFMEKGIAD
ncbi:GNAT family N-acetyltransferase [Aliiroseovarius sp. PTFE2010]|uniref:GNAT family N-acetyltransferase n=1 Tax=Aliiroseovarius sp. PTFE2010 TaxID=3417190 RepID=UPI003CF73FEA